MAANVSAFAANAVIPDQLVPYVAAVSGLESSAVGCGLLHRGGGQAVLIAYPPGNALDMTAANAAVEKVLSMPGIEQISVLAADRPAAAPGNASITRDWYWKLPLPAPAPQPKLRNMLKRAARDLTVEMAGNAEAWTPEHAGLALAFGRRKASLDAGTIFLLGRLQDYLAGAPDALLFSARRRSGNSLAAFAIGDFTPLATCFYMFACRAEDAPPGAADLLLAAIIEEGINRGHSQLNLGLGIDAGIEFFKKKWGAEKFLPLAETSWKVKHRGGLLARLLGR